MSIVLENLTKRYERHSVVSRVGLTIGDGEFFVMLGPSGSGKSTILRMIAGLTEVEALRQLNYHCTRLLVAGQDMTKEVSMAKLKAGRLAREVSDTCLQFHGGMGYVEEYPMARYFRDARLLSIGGGADEVMLRTLAKLDGFG